MDLKKLLGLRPRENTAGEIEAAGRQVEAELAAAVARVSDLRASRGGLLLDGDAGTVAQAEAALAEAEAERDRLAAMAEALGARGKAARDLEADTALRALRADADGKLAAWKDWYRVEYPALASAIRAGLMLEREAAEAQRRLQKAALNRPGVVEPHTIGTLHAVLPGWNHMVAAVGSVVVLPPAEFAKGANTANIWPPAA